MGLAAIVLAVLTVSFLCLPWIEPLVTTLLSWRLRRRPAASDTAGDEVVVMARKMRQEDENEEEGIVKVEKGNMSSSTALISRSVTEPKSNPSTVETAATEDDDDDALPSVSDPRQWRQLNRCFCEDGGLVSFLPPGVVQDRLKSAGALLQLGAGGCYHKATDQKLW